MWVDLDKCWQTCINATTARNNCKERCHAGLQSILAQSRGGLAVKSDGFICTPVSGVNNNRFMQHFPSMKLVSCLGSHLAITEPCLVQVQCRCWVLFWSHVYIYTLLITYCCYQQLSPTSAWNSSSGLFLSPAIHVSHPTEFPCNHDQCYLVELG